MADIPGNNRKIGRFPNLGRLSIAILEALVKPVLGEEGIKEIKAPVVEKELQKTLADTLINTEKRFLADHSDKELCEAILNLPLATVPTLQQAVRKFYDRPSDPSLEQLLKERLSSDFPRLASERVDQAVSTYIVILHQELVSVSTDIRDKLKTLAALSTQESTERIADTMDDLLETYISKEYAPPRPGSAPPVPSLIVGREGDLIELKERLDITIAEGEPRDVQILTAIRGWPGVGKTTIVSAFAHDPDVLAAFPDGILWVSLGPNPNLLSEIATWGRALDTDLLLRSRTLEEASAQLRALFRDKRALLIIDDVWESEHAVPFNVGGRGCATLITTRLRNVAEALAPTPDNVYLLPVLTDEKALELLNALAPSVIARYSTEALDLVHELEGLPLALQVAGRLLHTEAGYGFGVKELIADLREGAKLLKAKAPTNRTDVANETTPTVAVLIQKSVERLDQLTQDCYAYLGVFAAKPATFDLEAMTAVWQVDDPKPVARTLVDRGLLEYIPEMERYQMHAVLVMHANSLLA